MGECSEFVRVTTFQEGKSNVSSAVRHPRPWGSPGYTRTGEFASQGPPNVHLPPTCPFRGHRLRRIKDIDGLDVHETTALSARVRAGIAGANIQLGDLPGRTAPPERAYGVLARARRSDRPGVVFARAAARGEVDPLEDIDARILCGLPVK